MNNGIIPRKLYVNYIIIEKGSQRFRPVTKPRPGARAGDPTSRQASSVPESVAGRESIPRATPFGQATFRAPIAASSSQTQVHTSIQPNGASSHGTVEETTGSPEADTHPAISAVAYAIENTGNQTEATQDNIAPVTWTTPWMQENGPTREFLSVRYLVYADAVVEVNHPQATPSTIVVGSSRNSRPPTIVQGPRRENSGTSSTNVPQAETSRDTAGEGHSEAARHLVEGTTVSDAAPVPVPDSTLQFANVDISTRAAVEAITNTIFSAQSQAQSSAPEATFVNAPGPSQISPAGNDAQETKNGRSKAKKSSRKGKERVEQSEQADGAVTVRKRRKSSNRQTSTPKTDATGESEGGTDSEHAPKRGKRKRHSDSPSRPRRSREKSLSSFDLPIDLDADPGEDIDPTATTMAAICADAGRGRVSSKVQSIRENHLAWKAVNKAKRARLRALMESKKLGRTQEEAEAAVDAASENVNDVQQQEPGGISPAINGVSMQAPTSTASAHRDPGASGSGSTYGDAMSTNRFNVQIRIGPNGETIVDEESLYVDRAENPEYSTEQYTHVEESDQTKFTNSMSYSKKSRGSRWSAEETELFYEVGYFS